MTHIVGQGDTMLFIVTHCLNGVLILLQKLELKDESHLSMDVTGLPLDMAGCCLGVDPVMW